jgi:hypothetical protein
MADELLARLQAWYLRHCNGDWEHEFGVHIDTLDNPGWHVRIDLERTPLEQRPMPDFKIERGEHDWVMCGVRDGDATDRRYPAGRHFSGACGPENLAEVIKHFLEWAEESRSVK